MGEINVLEDVFQPPRYEITTYTYEELRAIFDRHSIVWALLDRIEELEEEKE